MVYTVADALFFAVFVAGLRALCLAVAFFAARFGAVRLAATFFAVRFGVPRLVVAFFFVRLLCLAIVTFLSSMHYDCSKAGQRSSSITIRANIMEKIWPSVSAAGIRDYR